MIHHSHGMHIEPISEGNWNDLLKMSHYASPFHDFKWGQLVTSILGGTYRPLVAMQEDCQWLIPGYTSTPWGSSKGSFRIGSIGYGGPLPIHTIKNALDEIQHVHELFHDLHLHFDASQIRATLYPDPIWNGLSHVGLQMSNTYKIALTSNRDMLFHETLSGNVRTAIRKSEKEGVTVHMIDTSNQREMQQAYHLLCQTQKSVGSNYTTPYELFTALATNQLTSTRTQTFVAFYKDSIVGTTTLVYGGSEAFHLFHGWDRTATASCSNQALIWSMICFALENSLSVFNMGASHSDALLKAKMQWGGHLEYVPTIHLAF